MSKKLFSQQFWRLNKRWPKNDFLSRVSAKRGAGYFVSPKYNYLCLYEMENYDSTHDFIVIYFYRYFKKKKISSSILPLKRKKFILLPLVYSVFLCEKKETLIKSDCHILVESLFNYGIVQSGRKGESLSHFSFEWFQWLEIGKCNVLKWVPWFAALLLCISPRDTEPSRWEQHRQSEHAGGPGRGDLPVQRRPPCIRKTLKKNFPPWPRSKSGKL